MTGFHEGQEATFTDEVEVEADADDEFPSIADTASSGLESPTAANKGGGPPGSDELGGQRSSVVRYVDDSSLNQQTSSVRFRGSELQVVTLHDRQIVLEDKYKKGASSCDYSGGSGKLREEGDNGTGGGGGGVHEIKIKSVNDDTFSHLLLRSIYSLVAVFFGGFLFVFCLQIILFVYMDIVAQANQEASKFRDGIKVASMIFSVPVYVHGLSSVMTLATAFVIDTWRGTRLHRWVGWQNWPLLGSVASEWLSFVVFLLVPAMAAIVTLFAGFDDWWAKTLLTWFSSVFVLWAVFSAIVFHCEMSTCLALVREMDGYGPSSTIQALIRGAIRTIQTRRFSGVCRNTYIVKSGDKLSISNCKKSILSSGFQPVRVQKSLFSCMSLWLAGRGNAEEGPQRGCGFTKLDFPEPFVTFQDLKGAAPVVTADTWSLEKFYCRHYAQNSLFVVNGPSRVTRAQRRSSFVCIALGNIVIVLIIAALFSWLSIPALGIIGFVVIVLVCCIPNIRTLYNQYQLIHDIGQTVECEEEGNISDDAAVYQMNETLRVTEPLGWLCWFNFGLSVFFFGLWPLIFFFVTGNVESGVIFLIFCIFSGARRYLNAADVLKELGSIDYLDTVIEKKFGVARNDGSSEDAGMKKAQWAAKSRLVEVLEHISRGGARNVWRSIFWGLAIVFGAMAVVGVVKPPKQNSSIAEMQGSLHDFYYEPQSSLSYPTCELKKGFQVDGGRTGDSLSDITYLAAMVYNDPAFYQGALDKWFGDDYATDQPRIVEEFQSTYYPNSPVRYSLTTFSTIPGVGVVSIRGTVNILDMFIDAQLWAGAALLQALRGVLPLSRMWTPVLKDLTTMMSIIETDSLAKHAYYVETREFVKHLLERSAFDRIIVTGHSLGGGVAMITGAQAGVRSIGVSGPNAMLSRGSFDPPISEETLNEYTFNIIPDRDLIPRLDDRARLFQEIECRAPKNNLFGCHDVLRSLCAIQYHCGSGLRPAMCSCALKFGYPEPIQNGTRSFKDACLEEYPAFEDIISDGL